MTIQQAMLDSVRSRSGGPVPPKLQWGNLTVQTSDCIAVPRNGRIRLEFVSAKPGIKQGVDIRVNGAIRLADGEGITTLRTWEHPDYEGTVEYPFQSLDGELWVWNVYEVTYLGREVEVMKWTDNAGFWVEDHGNGERTYHCSAGQCNPPDFEALVFKIKVF